VGYEDDMDEYYQEQKMKKEQTIISNYPYIYNDEVSKCDIMLNVKGEMYIIRDGKKMRLNAFIIKERRES